MRNFFTSFLAGPKLLIALLILTYWRVPQIFFIQDEWQTFGLVISQGIDIVYRGLGDGKILHFIPVNNFLNFLSFNLFGLNYQFYNIVGLLFHLINAYILYLLSKKIFNSNFLALTSAIVFITSSIPNQLIMWPVVSLNTLSLSFALLALFFVIDISDISDQNQKNFISLGIVVALLMLFSILTLEYAVGIMIFIPFISYVFIKKRNVKNLFLFLLPLVLVSIFYLSIRIYPFINLSQTANGNPVNIENYIKEKLIKFPVRYVGQVFIPQDTIEKISKVLSTGSDKSQEYFFTKISFVSGAVILMISILVLLIDQIKNKNSKLKYSMLFSLIFILCSSLPFLFIPGLAGSFVLYPPRYLYFGLVGAVFLLTSLLSFVISYKNNLMKISVTLSLFLYIIYNIWGNWMKSEELYQAGQVRLEILKVIKGQHPVLRNNVIFYIESDSSFYGLPPRERILPFQSGFGQTLLVWYNLSEDFSNEFFKNKFLWGITEQGFKRSEGRGFGYFRDFETMASLVDEKKIPLESIIAYNFISDTGRVNDISEEVRGRVMGYMLSGSEVEVSLYSTSASNNSEDSMFVQDENRFTYWDSKLPYSNPLYFDIDLGLPKTVVQISIDSYNNKNQNAVGYRVLLSDDKKSWNQVFLAKQYPPDENGFVKLFIKPTKTRYIRIDQIGKHQYANWVIHELKVYEVN